MTRVTRKQTLRSLSFFRYDNDKDFKVCSLVSEIRKNTQNLTTLKGLAIPSGYLSGNS